ncbi:MAG: phage terminase large subunit family protein [Oricola sp.]|nr:phage terminase large subunit family protein [Oricola sp.]
MAISAWMPPPELTVSQWADRYRRLSPEASSEPGKWVTDRAPYQRGMMDAVNEPGVAEVVFMTSSQIGKTEILNNIIGYFTHQDPSPILMIQPTLDMAETWSKDRLAPMIRDTDALTSLFKDPKSRDSDNTLLHKKFAGGHITMAGANSPASLASRPIRIVLLDEEDRYPVSAGTEGDPGSLAHKRTTTFWNRLLVSASTPTVEGESKIEARFQQSDQRHFYVPCPECGTFQVLGWAQIKFEKRQPETTYYECEHCKAKLQESDKIWMLAHGEWRAEAELHGIAGFHISELYSPWVRWSEMVAGFLKAKRLPETLKVWVNTSLGETWKDKTEGVDPSGLLKRKENWGRVAPEGVVAITAGVDVQDDRLEAEVIGWGVSQESWSLQYHVLHGDPAQSKVWDDLDTVLQQTIQSSDGRTLSIACACVDSGGHQTQRVYEYCKAREHNRVFAIKGASQIGKPLVSKFSKNNKLRVKLFTIGTDTAKQMIYSRLKIHQTGPGYCHFPADYPEEYFKQLTAERIQTKFVNGHPTRVWVMPKGRRNEALDCRVYGLAALHILNPNLDALATEQERDRLRQREAKEKQESRKTSEWMGYDDWNFT